MEMEIERVLCDIIKSMVVVTLHKVMSHRRNFKCIIYYLWCVMCMCALQIITDSLLFGSAFARCVF